MKQRGKKKRIKRNEDNLRGLWDNVKCPNSYDFESQESQKKKTKRKAMRKYLRR